MPRTDRASLGVDAPVARVFEALIDRDQVLTWLPPEGMTATFEWFDPRPGGSYRLVLTHDDPTRHRGRALPTRTWSRCATSTSSRTSESSSRWTSCPTTWPWPAR
ncbi:MAG: SRPBCC domain-containing protein [Acidimicrobiia bacterium]